ncbi:MAG TPA: helix-turn-helix domain-containing protein [Mycobacteriales bacterium]|jgi:AcrR family transcriptional regulator|nr:helix-turn-helix domain-containing protein [Mycobacteriales bacterium]
MTAGWGGETSEHLVPIAAGTTRATILAAAQRLFGEKGYDATSLRQIADAVGTTKAAVYYHFPAKEHLLLELSRPWLDALGTLVTEMRRSAHGDGDGEAAATLEAYLDVCIAHLAVLNLLARDPATANHPDIGRRALTLIEAVKHHIAGEDASDDRLVHTSCAIGVVHAVAGLPADLVAAHRQTFLDSAIAALNANERTPGAKRERQSSRRNVATQ